MGKESTITDNGWNDLNNIRKENMIDIGPLIKEETMNGTEWEVKKEQIQQDFFELGTRSNTPNNMI